MAMSFYAGTEAKNLQCFVLGDTSCMVSDATIREDDYAVLKQAIKEARHGETPRCHDDC